MNTPQAAGDGVAEPAVSSNGQFAHVQASAAQALYQQGEVARLLAWERYMPEPISSPPVAPVERIARAYGDSRGRGRGADLHGAMLDVWA